MTNATQATDIMAFLCSELEWILPAIPEFASHALQSNTN